MVPEHVKIWKTMKSGIKVDTVEQFLLCTLLLASLSEG